MPNSKSLQSPKQATAQELIGTLPARLPQVASFTFTRYTPRPSVEERLRKTSIVSEGADERVHLTATANLKELATLGEQFVVAELMRHDEANEASKEFVVAASALTSRYLSECTRSLSGTEVLAISSRCTLHSGDIAHLPLLDFRPPPSEANQKLVYTASKTLGIDHGAVLNSGRSYHVYGFCTLPEKQWLRMMLKSLLLTSLVDVRYIAHRLLAERAALRITTSSTKETEPFTVQTF